MAGFNPWAWFPVGVIALVAIPNLAMITVARRAHISQSEAHPWLASASLDVRDRAAAAFASRSRFVTSIEGRRLTCRIDGALPATSAAIALWRPDNASLDRHVPWPDPSVPLVTELSALGRWRILLEVDGVPAVAEMRVEVQP